MAREKETIITKLEKGRAEFAYKCVAAIIEPKKDKNLFIVLKKALEKFFQKDIKDGKITIDKINNLLENIKDFSKKEYNNISVTEKKVVEFMIKLKKDYRSYVKKLPQMILSNGLGQSMAFVFSKKKEGNAYAFIYQQISEYLNSNNTIRISKDKDKDLLEWIISLDSHNYRYATEEVLAFLNWLRRFAEGMIEVSEEEND